MKYLILLVFSLFFIKNTVNAQTSYGTLEGKMIDKETGEGLIAASVTIYKAGKEIPSFYCSTDIDGIFSIDSIPVGMYDVEFSYLGYETIKTQKIEIKANDKLIIKGELEEDYKIDETNFIGTRSYPRLFSPFGTGRVYTSGDIQNMPIKW